MGKAEWLNAVAGSTSCTSGTIKTTIKPRVAWATTIRQPPGHVFGFKSPATTVKWPQTRGVRFTGGFYFSFYFLTVVRDKCALLFYLSVYAVAMRINGLSIRCRLTLKVTYQHIFLMYIASRLFSTVKLRSMYKIKICTINLQVPLKLYFLFNQSYYCQYHS